MTTAKNKEAARRDAGWWMSTTQSKPANRITRRVQPMSGRRMVTEIARSGVTWQTGSQNRSGTYFREAVEFVRNGRLDKSKEIKVGLPGGHQDFNTLASRKQPEPVPEGLNWDFWEGPAPHSGGKPDAGSTGSPGVEIGVAADRIELTWTTQT